MTSAQYFGITLMLSAICASITLAGMNIRSGLDAIRKVLSADAGRKPPAGQ